MGTKTRIEIDVGTRTFSSGLLPELIAALRRCSPGDLLAVIGREADIGADLESWCRFTRNSLIDTTIEAGGMRWVIRCGEAPAAAARAMDVRPGLGVPGTGGGAGRGCGPRAARVAAAGPDGSDGVDFFRRGSVLQNVVDEAAETAAFRPGGSFG